MYKLQRQRHGPALRFIIPHRGSLAVLSNVLLQPKCVLFVYDI